MDISSYIYNGQQWKPSSAVLDNNNSFFHSTFGVRIEESDTYYDKKTNYRRSCWATFLTYFETEPVPHAVANILKKCFSTNEKYKCASIEDKNDLKNYVHDIRDAKQGVTVEEIPIIATLENIRIVLFSDRRSSPIIIINPDSKFLGDYSHTEKPKDEVVLLLEGKVFSRMNPISESISVENENKEPYDKKSDEYTMQCSSCSTKCYEKYQKRGNAGSEGVQYQVELSTVFFLKAFLKLKNWKLSTENNKAGKFDDVVLECSEGTTLVQAKHRQSKSKKITLQDLMSTNKKSNDFSLPKYFLSYEELKKQFQIKEVIICTNASVDDKVMELLVPHKISSESILFCEGTFYTFKDNIFNDLRENVKRYYEIIENKLIDQSIITDGKIKDFLKHLQLYIKYHPGNVIEKLLSHIKRSENWYGQISPSDVYDKIFCWFQQKTGVYLNEIYAKAIFAEIRREKRCQILEKFNMSFQCNSLDLKNSKRILHVHTGSLYLTKELHIFQWLQDIKQKTLYANTDDDNMKVLEHTIDAFHMPLYTFLILIWPKIGNESFMKKVSNKLREILDESQYKRVILVAPSSNTISQHVGLSIDSYDVSNLCVRFEDLSKDSQEWLLKKKNISFQGNDINLEELLGRYKIKGYGEFLNSELLENIIKGEKLRVGVKPLDLDKNTKRFYINRKFIKEVNEDEDENKKAVQLNEETIYEVNEKVIIIADCAGMGKSTVLTKLAIFIKESKPHLWVIRIDLNDYTYILNTYLDNTSKIINILDLLNSKDSTKLINQLEERIFELNRMVVLMVDGVDEISPDYTELILNLLASCQGRSNFSKIFVTTRPNTARELKEKLQVKPFSMQPFTEQNQIDFLTGYWMHNLEAEETIKHRCEAYAKALIIKMSSWIRLYHYGENHFAAIPLQVRMLAETFQERPSWNETTYWEGCKEYLYGNEAEPKLPERMKIKKIYDMFINKKRNLFICKGNPTNNSTSNNVLNKEFEECLMHHRCLALNVIISSRKRDLFPDCRHHHKDVEENTFKIGIVQRFEGTFQFLHRTFAEYFVAQSLLEELKNCHAEFQRFLVDAVLIMPEYNVTRIFFDSFLQETIDSLPSTTFKNFQSQIYLRDSTPRNSLIHILAKDNCIAILQLILKCTYFRIVRDNEVTILKVVKNNGDFTNTLNDLQILLKEGGINIKDENGNTLLHYAAQENHLEMVKFLVSQGAKVDCMNESGSLALHLAAEEGQLDCVIFFAEIGVDINTPNKDNRTALHLASKWGRLDIVKFLVKRDANANIRDKDGRTALHFASERGVLDTVKFLVERNKHIINIKNNDGRSALHLATDWCQPETIEFLAGFDNIDVNIKDNTGCTPLHFAVRDNEMEIVEFFVDVGIDVNLRNNDGHTALHLASKEGYSDIVDFLLRRGANMNIMDNEGYTPLHLAVAGTSYDIEKSIVQEGVNVGDNVLQQIQTLGPSNKELISAKNDSQDNNKYEKRGSTVVEGVQFQVGLLTVFLLNALRKVKNWRISTENATAGKFDDVVFECPEGATLVKAKYRQIRKKINFKELMSINLKDDFSLPKYFSSYQEIKKKFRVKEIIICTNSSMEVKTMKLFKTHKIPFESMLNYEDDDCIFYTFNDEILPYLKENIINYNKIHSKNKDVSETTDEDIRDFLGHLQVYSSYPSGDQIGKIVEKLLSQLKRIEILPCKISSKSLDNKIMDWYQQKFGMYLAEINAKAIFSEIWRDERWKTLERFNIFLLRNELNFQNSKRIIHVIIEDGYLLQEIKIFRAFQHNKINILYANADDGMKIVKQVIEAFRIPQYTILVLIWAKTAERSMGSVLKEIGSILREILNCFEDKKVVLVTKRNNKFPKYIGLRNSKYEVVNESISFEDMSKDSREWLLKKKIVIFQGKNISMEELFGTQTTENYKKFLSSEVVEKLIRGDNITIGTAHLDGDYYTRFYIHRKFKRQTKDNKDNRKVIMQDKSLTEENIYNVDEKIIIISDHAGTGKSTVLTKLAAVIKENNPHLWVFRINLNDYTRILREYLSTYRETINILELINSKYSTKLENELEEYVFSIRRKVVILLDGLDEVSPDYTQLITRLIEQCQNEFNIAKVIVATRPHLMRSLENKFQVNPFILEPLTEQNYVDIFTKYWMYNLNLVNKDKDKCEQYAKSLVRKMWLQLYQQKNNYFPVVPLQVQIITELFQENNQLKETTNWEGCREYLLSDSIEPKLPENLNMINMYQIFLEKKRIVFLDKGNPSGNMAANRALSEYFDECLQAHRSLALEIILGENSNFFSFYKQSSIYLGSSYDYLLKIGILQKLDNKFDFIDKSFAEYFVAESLLRELVCLNQNVDFQKLLIEEILSKPQFNITRAFFDSCLQQVIDDIPSNIFQNYENVTCEFDLVNKNNVTLLHQLVEEGHVAILKLLFKCIDFNNITERKINLTDLNMTYFDGKILKNVFGNTLNFLKYLVGEAGVNIKDENGVMPLHIASKKGHLEMVKFLVRYGAIIDSRDIIERTSLRLAVDGGHIEVAKFLVDQNADIKAQYKYVSILEDAIQEGQISIATYILENILKSNGLERKDSIKYLFLQGTDFNKKDSNGKTALHLAVSQGRLDTVKFLVQLIGMDSNMRDENGRTYFHLAALWNQLDIAEFFIEVGVNVNDKDEEGCTALHLVAETDRFDIVNFLVTLGLDVNIRNNNGQTALHLAACCGKLDTVKFLHIECSADLNVKDSDERTALHLAVEKDEQKIIKFLVKQGININIPDKNGRTALHLAASKGSLHTVKFLLKHGGDYDITDNGGCTALNLALSNGRTDTAKFLEKHVM